MIRRWVAALVPIALTCIALAVYFTVDDTFGLLMALLIALVAVLSAFTGRPEVIGSTVPVPGRKVDPRQVKAYRVEHPGATISEAFAALSRQS